MLSAGSSSVQSAKEILRDTADRLASGRTPSQWDFMLQMGRRDKAIVDSLQLGVASGSWQGGVFDLRDERSGERGVPRFNQMIVDWLAPVDKGGERLMFSDSSHRASFKTFAGGTDGNS